MNDRDHTADCPATANSRYVVLKTAFILYMTLGILAFAIPQSLVNWARDLKPSLAQELILIYAEQLEQASRRKGADEFYNFTRNQFLQLTGKEKD